VEKPACGAGFPLSLKEQYMRVGLASRLGFALGPLLSMVIAATGCVSAGSHGGTGGSTGSGTGGSTTGGGGTGGAATGGTGGTGGSGSGGNQAGTDAGADAAAGATGALHGGASARFICQAGATYGNPLTGMGTIMQIMQPGVNPIYSFSFIEGPVWLGSQGIVVFSDNAASPYERIIQVKPPSTVASSFMEMSGSNGLALDNDDNLILADQHNHRITRVSSTTATQIGAPLATGTWKPNDVLVRSDNNIYFTDPDTGFYRISPSGALSGPLTQVAHPNGIEMSLDERTLYVGDVTNQMIYTFALGADGSIDTSTFKHFVTTASSTVDGMCVDCAGNLYAGTSNGVEVFSPAGAPVGVVPTGESSNCTFGGADRKTLYVTSRSLLKYVTLGVPGLPD
jgi:gluconolactonase